MPTLCVAGTGRACTTNKGQTLVRQCSNLVPLGPPNGYCPTTATLGCQRATFRASGTLSQLAATTCPTSTVLPECPPLGGACVHCDATGLGTPLICMAGSQTACTANYKARGGPAGPGRLC